jgi:mannosyltransferase
MLAITMVGAALRGYHLGLYSLWYDEAFTAWTVAQIPKDIIWIGLQDVVHPPLYYLLLSFTSRLIGNSEFSLRALSAAISLLGLPLLYQLGWRGWDRRVGLAAALLWACLPFPVWYGQEARMYAMLTVVGLAAALCLVRALPGGSRRWLIANAILNLIGLHTHYFYFFSLLSQYLYLASTLRRHRRAFWRWFAMNGVAASLYLPWGVAILRGGFYRAQIAWVEPLSLHTVWQTFWEFAAGPKQPISLPAAFVLLVLVGGVIAAAVVGRAPRRSVVSRLSWIHLLVPLALVALISIVQPLFHSRFLQITLPFCLLLVAAGLMRLPRRWVGAGLLAITVLASALSLRAVYATPVRYLEDWRAAVDYLATHADPEDAVAFRGGQGWHAYWYYYDGPPLHRVSLQPEEELDDLSAKAAGSRRIWLVIWDVYRSCEPPAQFIPGRDDPLEIADEQCFPEALLVSYAWRGQQK